MIAATIKGYDTFYTPTRWPGSLPPHPGLQATAT